MNWVSTPGTAGPRWCEEPPYFKPIQIGRKSFREFCCRRASASRRRTGTSERQMRFIRTSMSSTRTMPIHRASRRRSHLQDGLRAHAAAACRAARRRHHRLPRDTARGSRRVRIIDVDDEGIVKSFLEKPADPPPMPGKPDTSLASMGIYVFVSRFLFHELRGTPTRIRATISARI